jgi:glycosyltransferase involved in cell wall biosynthesis
MRIALIAPPWLPVPPPAYGGIEAVVDRLARGFRAAGHEVLLFTNGESTCPVPRAWILPRAASDRMGRSLEELQHVIAAYQAARDYDIVHDHTLAGPLLARSARRSPVVTTAHFPIRGQHHALYQALAGRVPIIAVSRSQLAPDVPVAGVIPHGLDLRDFPPGPGAGDYLLFLGRMDPDKGVEAAVLAARRLGVRLLVAAKMQQPWERAYYQDRVRPLLGGLIEYVGEPAADQRLALLQDARALVLPLRWAEPFGLVMVEALACGTPVVATAMGAAPEIVEHGVTGFLVEDDEALVGALDRVDEIDRAACRRAAVTRFSSERMVTAHLELYERLLTRQPLRIPIGTSARQTVRLPLDPALRTTVPLSVARSRGGRAWV